MHFEIHINCLVKKCVTLLHVCRPKCQQVLIELVSVEPMKYIVLWVTISWYHNDVHIKGL